MAPYQLTIAYDGTEFFGFQRQKNQRTVQEVIEKALRRIGWTDNSILSAGRTDAGVHADGQVVAFRLDWPHESGELIKALNANLPSDISVKGIRKTSESFHPRFHAKQRKYRYQLLFAPRRDPLKERYFWRVWPKPDLGLMQSAAELLLGTHDFSEFGKPPKDEVTTMRTIDQAEWRWEDSTKAFFSIASKAFLYHMVRRIVFLLIRVGHRKLDAIELENSFENQGKLPAGIAPAHGLFLESVNYE